MTEDKNQGGRPLKFQSVEELEDKIDAYFSQMQIEERPFTITGLAVALDCDRKTLLNYESREEFFPTIKKAKQIIENYTEERLFGNNVTGVIFNLKNNYGWQDKHTQESQFLDENGKPTTPPEGHVIKVVDVKRD